MAYRRLLAFFALFLLLVAVPARAGADPAAAGQPGVSQQCVLEVVEDLTLTGDLHCVLELRASGVTIDLAGFTLHGHIVTPAFGIGDVVIRDGRVEGFIELGETGNVEVRNLTIHNFGGAGAISPGHRTRITDSHFENNHIAIWVIEDWSSGAVIERSTFVGNDIAVAVDALFTEVVDNRFVDNQVGVRLVEFVLPVNGAVVARNQFDRNQVAVEMILGGVTPWREPAIVAGNRITRSGEAGIDVRLGDGLEDVALEISGNQVMHGDGDGVRVGPVDWPGLEPVSPAGVTLTANHAFHNGGFGIHAPGVTDGGRNHGHHNGGPAQCVGVDCRPPGRQG